MQKKIMTQTFFFEKDIPAEFNTIDIDNSLGGRESRPVKVDFYAEIRYCNVRTKTFLYIANEFDIK